MAMQIHMKIEGVSGDAKGFNHKGWCDVLSLNWGMTSNREAASGRDDGDISLNELSITKAVGIDSASIRLLFAEGKLIPSVDLKVIPAASKRVVPTKYLDMKLENVLIKSIVVSGDSEDSVFREHISLLFDRVRFEYSLDPVRGGVDDVPVANDFSWDVPANCEWKH